MTIQAALNIVQVILALVVITLGLLQVRGQGFAGLFGSDSSSVYRTRRGFERVLFQAMIGGSAAFFVVAFVNSFLSR